MPYSFRILLYLFLFIAFTTSCQNKKSTTETVTSENNSATEQSDDLKMKALGFVKATVKDFSSNEGCGFLIVLTETKQVLQPLKPLGATFQKEGLIVWIKYRPIRPIAPVCKKGTPIDLEEIKKG